ncbi:MAG: DUF5698 domain-containing protein [Desulfobacterota bacterium]|nr:DUF5698 domain-containing protein [Thermodesulfobacteriota bacterium]
MLQGFDLATLLLGIVIFLARVTDVSMGTMRTISIVQGRTRIAFLLGFVEVSMWLVIISTVIHSISEKPVLGVFYALGFSTGNVVGIILERRLAFGHVILRIISPRSGKEIAEKIRQTGHAVTTFQGEGLSGPVTMLYVVCPRKEQNEVVQMVRSIEPDAFYTVDMAGSVSKIYRACMPNEPTGWRAIFKKK